ncbi:MAG: hypothetical protein E7062_02920 [Spirochaetaceae bacterium]|nr:hypothetical protein [Spirochaetaceae bacterium]
MLIEKDDVADVLSDFCVIAEIFGSRKDFEVLVLSNAEQKVQSEEKLIHSFCNNLNLLVQKTWIEKSDEAFKEQVINRISFFAKKLKISLMQQVFHPFWLLYKMLYTLCLEIKLKKQKNFLNMPFVLIQGLGFFGGISLLCQKKYSGMKRNLVASCCLQCSF